MAQAFPRVEPLRDALFIATGGEAADKTDLFDPQAMSNRLQSFGRLESWRPLLLSAATPTATSVSTEPTTQETSNVSWALAKPGSHRMPLPGIPISESTPEISELNRQEASVAAWAPATPSLRPECAMSGICTASVPRASVFGMLETSNLAWCLARLGIRGEGLREAAVSQAPDCSSCASESVGAEAPGIDFANPNGLYSIVWSSWRAGRSHLAWSLYQEERERGADAEALVHGLFVMNNEWGRTQEAFGTLDACEQSRPSV
eukprot:gnl/TRDRNA2_/TRDRNA2_176835_c0_seq2.p1 gnl/TRDRNA2_/TRDRNA2_176835_c0~~gnl/TRDRNA2_/TRDRNA2_176835_c0_seq2.p1  ORF type:complete len:262 (+),score=45.21 gnl/TRDRNA2_/TRDRNA2_176835_c0_seq2:572-1357(+)